MKKCSLTNTKIAIMAILLVVITMGAGMRSSAELKYALESFIEEGVSTLLKNIK